MASTSGNGSQETPKHVETGPKAEVEQTEAEDEVDDLVHVEEDSDSDGDSEEDIDGVDGLVDAAIEAIIPICGGCGAGRCRHGITDSGRVYLKCCIKEGFGSCGFFKWLDDHEIAESMKRIKEIAKKQG